MSSVNLLNAVAMMAVLILIDPTTQPEPEQLPGVMAGFDVTRMNLAGALCGSLVCSLYQVNTHEGPANLILFRKVGTGFLISMLSAAMLSGFAYEWAAENVITKSPAAAGAVGFVVGLSSFNLIPMIQAFAASWFKRKTGSE